MAGEYQGVERRSGERLKADELRLQREANEKLVLTALGAQEEADAAATARRSAEEETIRVRAREEDLRVTAEFRERFIGIISHDLRNPLHTILMASMRQISRGELSEYDAVLAARIRTSAKRIERMIGQLAEFTRARLGGGFALTLVPSHMGSICKDIADELRIASSCEIHCTEEGDLSGTWDGDRIAQALSNLAGNAVDHASPGTPVLFQAREEAGVVVVEVTNHGACIAPEALPVIFAAFRRGEPDDRARAQSGHLGLGLYIASEIVRSHGGTIGVRSANGVTTFTMRLPREGT